MRTGWLALAMAALLLAGCSNASEGDPTGLDGLGTLRVLLKDAPADGVREIDVDVAGFRAKMHGEQAVRLAGDLGVYDLLALRDVRRLLLTASLVEGHYDYVIMDFDASRSYVVTEDGARRPLAIPAPSVNVDGAFDVSATMMTILTLDFDGERSLERLDDGSYVLRPVITVTEVAGPA